ncbi:MAG: hypothetical protein MHM6MM_004554 [Cercozoa sp. M6MM]
MRRVVRASRRLAALGSSSSSSLSVDFVKAASRRGLSSCCDFSAMSTRFPTWHRPQVQAVEPLRLLNSLTGQKEDFVPSNPDEVTWYTCGPTVYDVSHLGHARTFVTFDIMRRILQRYFRMPVRYAMNITDVDDKIITRARQNHVLALLVQSGASHAELIALAEEAFNWKADKLDKSVAKAKALAEEADARYKKDLMEEADSKLFQRKNVAQELVKFNDLIKLADVEAALKIAAPVSAQFLDATRRAELLLNAKLASLDNDLNKAKQLVLEAAELATVRAERSAEVDQAYLAQVQKAKEASDAAASYEELIGNADVITLLTEHVDFTLDSEIFLQHSQKFEAAFWDDMRRLNVLPPDHLTRVTEFVPQIVEFVQKIISQGLAYASIDGSVYFDVASFKQSHDYPKLRPDQMGNTAAIADAEGSLTGVVVGKKSPLDFALWKASKAGEPAWDSPWGPGRPGWHIECSVMASDVFGTETIDLHAGGDDLKFPHHDNELAQSEAHFGHQQWVNYFLHAGRLDIQGRKMAKSLKNFVTIGECLEDHDSNHVRLLFLQQSWNGRMAYSDGELASAAAKARALREFLLAAAYVERRFGISSPLRFAQTVQTATENDRKLAEVLRETRSKVDAALRDSMDYKNATKALFDLVTEANKNIVDELKQGGSPKAPLIAAVAGYVRELFDIFGVDLPSLLGSDAVYEYEQDTLFDLAVDLRDALRREARQALKGQASLDDTAKALELLKAALASTEISGNIVEGCKSFAQSVGAALAADESPKVLLQLADRFRNEQAVALGIRIEDVTNGVSMWKKLGVKAMQQEIADRQRDELRKAVKKYLGQCEESERQVAQMLRFRATPEEVLQASGKYGSERDDKGLPTTDVEGEPLSKKASKAAAKMINKQKKDHARWLKALEKDDNPLRTLVSTYRRNLEALQCLQNEHGDDAINAAVVAQLAESATRLAHECGLE